MAGLPGFVRDCEYQAEGTSTTVTVRRTDFYTIVTVNGVDVYFYRLSGVIDGVGFNQVSDCMMGGVPELEHSGVGYERSRHTVQK